MEFGVARNIDATEANAPKMGTFDAASLKALESGLLARLAELSDDQRNKVIQRTIDILRKQKCRVGSRSSGKPNLRLFGRPTLKHRPEDWRGEVSGFVAWPRCTPSCVASAHAQAWDHPDAVAALRFCRSYKQLT
jgi:hypothetical protein